MTEAQTLSALTDLTEIVGFFSYSREDDDDSRGALSALRDAIQRELRAQLGRSRRELRLWQDKEAIAPGRLWEGEIKVAVDQAVFFIPIITPTVVRSHYCRVEFEAFLAREQALGRHDLVFPILYIRVPELEDEARWRKDPLLSIIGSRQYVDWRSLRLQSVEDVAVKRAVEELCGKIAESLRAPVAFAPPARDSVVPKSPEELTEAAAEAERRRARELREAQEAAERQRAEAQAAERRRAEAEERERREAERRRLDALRQEERQRSAAAPAQPQPAASIPAGATRRLPRPALIVGAGVVALALLVVAIVAVTGGFGSRSQNQISTYQPPPVQRPTLPSPPEPSTPQQPLKAPTPASTANGVFGTWKEHWPSVTYNDEFEVSSAPGGGVTVRILDRSQPITGAALNGKKLTFTLTTSFDIKYSLELQVNGDLVGTGTTPNGTYNVTWVRAQ